MASRSRTKIIGTQRIRAEKVRPGNCKELIMNVLKNIGHSPRRDKVDT